MFLYFQNKEKELEFVADVYTRDECEKTIGIDLDKRKYTKPFYFRVSEGKDDVVYDFGSWSEFYILKGNFK